MAWSEKPVFDTSDDLETIETLVSLKILEPISLAEYVCCPCGCGLATVERILKKDGTPVFLAFCDETGIPYPIDKTELKRWQINETSFARLIQREFKCPNAPERICRDLWYLGESGRSVAGRRRQIYFASRLTPEVYDRLPNGSSQILIVCELNPSAIDKFNDRIFQMHELISIHGNNFVVDDDLIESRLEKEESVKTEKDCTTAKDKEQKYRETLILDVLVEHIEQLRDAYWNSIERDLPFKLPRRLSYAAIANKIALKTNGAQTPDKTTVYRTMKATKGEEIPMYYKNMDDISFVKAFKRKGKYQRSLSDLLCRCLVNRIRIYKKEDSIANKKGLTYKLSDRPSYKDLAEEIYVITNGRQKPDESTVREIINEGRNRNLVILWENITNIQFVRKFKVKRRKTAAQDDEAFYEEQFSQTGVDLSADGLHVT